MKDFLSTPQKRLHRLSLVCLMLLAVLVSAHATDEVVVYNQIMRPGQTKLLSVLMNSENDYVAFQMDFVLPNGISVPANAEGDPDVTLAEKRSNGHIIATAYTDEGNVRVVVYSLPTTSLRQPSGVLLTMPIAAAADFEGEATMTVKNIRFSKANSKEMMLADATTSMATHDQHALQMTIEKGWNWVSQNTVNTQTLATFLQPFGEPTTVERMLSATKEIVNDPEFGIVGNLTALTPEEGYRLSVTDAQDYVAETGTWFWPEDRPIALCKGWNWIGYLPFAPLPVEVALADLTPQENDRIVGFDGFADYKDGQWVGSLTTMQPGTAYHYHAGADASFRYATCYPDIAAASSRANAPALSVPWEYDAHRHPDVTTVVARLTLDSQSAEGWVVGAFCGSECRGMAQQTGDVLFLNIHGTVGAGETIHFVAYNPTNSEQATLNEQLLFDGDCIGHINDPFPMTMNSIVTDVKGSHSLPPSVAIVDHELRIQGDVSTVAVVRVFAPNGMMIHESQPVGVTIATGHRLMRGVYSVVLYLKNGESVVRKVLL